MMRRLEIIGSPDYYRIMREHGIHQTHASALLKNPRRLESLQGVAARSGFEGYSPSAFEGTGSLTQGAFPVFEGGVNLAPVAGGLRDEATGHLRDLREDILGDMAQRDAFGNPLIENVAKPLDEDIARLRGADSPFKLLAGEIGGDIEALRGELNPFIQARVTPLREALSERVARTKQDYSRRGVFGTLRSHAVQNIETLGQREIADQTALATQEIFSSILQRQGLIGQLSEAELSQTLQRQGLAAQVYSAAFDQTLRQQGMLSTIANQMAAISQLELQSELAALQLSQTSINQILSSKHPSGTAGQSTATNPAAAAGVGLFGAGLTANALSAANTITPPAPTQNITPPSGPLLGAGDPFASISGPEF